MACLCAVQRDNTIAYEYVVRTVAITSFRANNVHQLAQTQTHYSTLPLLVCSPAAIYCAAINTLRRQHALIACVYFVRLDNMHT
jgi:uncharacterized membrane protein YwaF